MAEQGSEGWQVGRMARDVTLIVLGRDPMPMGLTQRRRKICNGCSESCSLLRKRRGPKRWCRACGSLLWAKTRLWRAACPRGYW